MKASNPGANGRAPEWIVASAAALWGLFWIPLREFEQMGLSPGWATISQFVAPLVCLTPFAIFRLYKRRPVGLADVGSGIYIGAAFALYCESLLLTDVVRALIFFYVMPAWGTIAEVVFMGRKFTWLRGVALLLSISGLLIVAGAGSGALHVWAFNLGDGMALLSGIAFTAGAMRVRQSAEISLFEQLYAFFFYGALIAVGLAFLPISQLGSVPSAGLVVSLTPWLLVMAVVFLIPVMGGIYWGSRHVDPGRLGLLLQLEAVVGISSAAVLAGEPFGVRELIGSVLVISAGVTEIFGNRGTNPA